MKKNICSLIILLFLTIIIVNCGNKSNTVNEDKNSTTDNSSQVISENAKVVFLELGSKSCIPCKKMVPVMEGIEKNFGDQVKVVFYDVKEDNSMASKYGIRLIPTQIFLDSTGQEFFRHEGYLNQEAIENLLIEKGLIKIIVE